MVRTVHYCGAAVLETYGNSEVRTIEVRWRSASRMQIASAPRAAAREALRLQPGKRGLGSEGEAVTAAGRARELLSICAPGAAPPRIWMVAEQLTVGTLEFRLIAILPASA
jgi:hypothetical protein